MNKNEEVETMFVAKMRKGEDGDDDFADDDEEPEDDAEDESGLGSDSDE